MSRCPSLLAVLAVVSLAVVSLAVVSLAVPAQAQDGPYPGAPGMGPGDVYDGPRGPSPGGEMSSDGGMARDGGMGAPADAGRDGGSDLSEETVTVDGVQRPYFVHVPQTLKQPAPVVFMFHGGGGHPQAIARKTGLDELADRDGFVAIYPEGSEAPSGRGGTWNIGSAQSPVHSDDVDYVRAILKDVGAHVRIDPDRVYAAGHSMGGIFTYRLACRMSGTFAAIAPVSATMVEPSCHPRSPVAVFHIQGSADDRIPLNGGHGRETGGARVWPAPQIGVTAWSRFDACEGDPSRKTSSVATCETYAHCRAEVEMCVIAGGGHPWPQDATGKIWAFFAAHPKVSP